MIVIQVKKVILRSKAGSVLSFDSYKRAQEWLASWEPEKYLKLIVAQDLDQALTLAREDISHVVTTSWIAGYGLKPEHLEFKIDKSEVKNGRFYATDGICLDSYLVVEE